MKKLLMLLSLVFTSSALAIMYCPTEITCTGTNYKNDCILTGDNFAWHFENGKVIPGTYSFVKADYAGKVYMFGTNFSQKFNPGSCFYQNGNVQITLKSKLANISPTKNSMSLWIWGWELVAQCNANSSLSCPFEFYN